MTRIATRLRQILTTASTAPVELQAGLLACAWGATLLWPTASVFERSVAWGMLAQHVPEGLLGALVMLLGIGQLGACLADWRHLRIWLMLMAWMWWLFLALMFGLLAPGGVAPATYGVIALFKLWAFLRLAGRLQGAI